MFRHPLTGRMFRLLILALLVLPWLPAGACDNRQEAVVASVRELSRAISSRDGEKAVTLYSRATIDYFDELVRRGREATHKEVSALPPLDQLEILCMRHRATPAELRGLDGAGYIKMAVSRGWWSRHAEVVDDDTVLPPIKISASTAWMDLELDSAHFYNLGDFVHAPDRKRYLKFFLEDGVWKLDVTSVHELFNEIFASAIRHSGEGNVDGIYMGIEQKVSGKPIDPSVWNPLKK